MVALDERIDDAMRALGDSSGDGAENCAFILNGSLKCRVSGCEWGYSCGAVDLWEVIIDAREHYETTHLSKGAQS